MKGRHIICPCIGLIIILILVTIPATTAHPEIEWREYRTTHFLIRFNPANRGILDKFLKKTEGVAEEALISLLPARLFPIIVYVVDTPDEFVRLQPVPGAVPPAALSASFLSQGIIIVKSPRLLPGGTDSLLEVFSKELAYLILKSQFFERKVPTWLLAGLTELAMNKFNLGRISFMIKMMFQKKVMPLWMMESTKISEEGENGRILKVQGYYFLKFIRDKYGKVVLKEFIRKYGSGTELEDSLSITTSADFRELLINWNKYITFRFEFLPIVTATLLMTALIVFFYIVISKLRYRKIRRMFEQLETERERRQGRVSSAP